VKHVAKSGRVSMTRAQDGVIPLPATACRLTCPDKRACIRGRLLFSGLSATRRMGNRAVCGNAPNPGSGRFVDPSGLQTTDK
jgi:hypothetical protein